jgi:large subunit ribosomal protein L4
MADAPVLGGAKRSVALDGDAFGARFNGPLIHESVRAEFAARRRGSASTKTRGLVSGGGAKPWRQKGTGRARAGSSRSPVWTGGGTVFGPHPRSYTFKVNRKERRAALRSALSLHAERGSLAVLDAGAFAEPSTSAAARLLGGWAQPRSTLVVVTAEERGAALSFRNIARVSVLEPSSVGVADIIGAASMLCSDAALAALTERAKSSRRGMADEPAEQAPAAKKAAAPKAEKPAAPEAATQAPVAEATVEQPAAKPPAQKKPAAKPAATKPAAKPPAEKKPAAKPTAAKPAAKATPTKPKAPAARAKAPAKTTTSKARTKPAADGGAAAGSED